MLFEATLGLLADFSDHSSAPPSLFSCYGAFRKLSTHPPFAVEQEEVAQPSPGSMCGILITGDAAVLVETTEESDAQMIKPPDDVRVRRGRGFAALQFLNAAWNMVSEL